MSNGTRDDDATVAIIAGNVASCVANTWEGTHQGGLNNPANREAFAEDVVAVARAIVAAARIPEPPQP